MHHAIGGSNSRPHLLFVSMYNSGRSQMAAAYINELAGGRFVAESAGQRPRDIDALVITAMRADGIDLSKTRSRSLRECWERQRFYEYVIAVTARPETLKCPPFPGSPRHLIWPFPNPRGFSGSRRERLGKIWRLRVRIKTHVQKWLDDMASGHHPADKVIPFQRAVAESKESRLYTV